MHEYALARAMLTHVETEARAQSATSVQRLDVRIGARAGVVPKLFASAFEICRRGTICEQARLVINQTEAHWACRSCGSEGTEADFRSCPNCAAPARLLSGDEIILERIDMGAA